MVSVVRFDSSGVNSQWSREGKPTTVLIVGNSMNDRKVDLWRLVAEQRRNESLLERLNEMQRKLENAEWHLSEAMRLVDDLSKNQ